MLVLRFGIRVNMVNPAASFDFNQFGDISDILSATSSRITAVTTTGAKVILTGSFNFSSESAFLNSTTTGIIIRSSSGSLIFSFTGIEDLTVGDFVFNPGFAEQSIVNQISEGVTIVGSKFSDVLVGDVGNDKIIGGNGSDRLIGGDEGDDTLKGGAGADDLRGKLGQDLLIGAKGNDNLLGGSGNDILKGGPGRDTLNGGDGSDIYIAPAKDTHPDLYTDTGSGPDIDVLDASAASTLLLSKTFNHVDRGLELIVGADEGTILLASDAGNKGVNWDFSDIDLINIAEMRGSLNADAIIGSTGSDFIKGRAGKDTLQGGEGNDELRGGKGADLLLGDTGDDTLKGAQGADTLNGGSGSDNLTGGPGPDDFIINGLDEANDTVTDFDRVEVDLLLLNGGVGSNQFQWGLQSSSATRANIVGAITSDFLFEAANQSALLSAISNEAVSLFGSTIGSGVSSIGYFFGFTTSNSNLFYIIANQHTDTGVTATTFNTVTLAMFEGITGIGTGANQISSSDIILF